jgi:hypothetical protein
MQRVRVCNVYVCMYNVYVCMYNVYVCMYNVYVYMYNVYVFMLYHGLLPLPHQWQSSVTHHCWLQRRKVIGPHRQQINTKSRFFGANSRQSLDPLRWSGWVRG